LETQLFLVLVLFFNLIVCCVCAVKELIEWRRRVLDQIIELKASQDDLSGLMASMDKMLKEKLKDLERMSKEKETLTVEVTKQVETIKMIEVRNNEAEEKVQVLSNELDQLRKEKQALEASFDQLSGSLTTCNATVSEKSRQEAQLQESLKQAQQAAKESSQQLEQLRSKLAETTEALSTCGNQCEKEKAEVSKLQARIMELERTTPVTIAAHPLPHPVPFCSAASYSIVAVAACAAILGYFKYRDVE
jgi:chromosome segregation ATPase